MVHLTTALDPASAVPLYEQLYRSLAAEMRAGTLTAGTRMPGKRRLAAELSVSVNTVDTAYQMLAVVIILILFFSVLYKRRFTVHELALTGVMAALSLVAYLFFRIPFYGGSSFHLGNTFTALTALLLDGVSGGLAGAIGLALADILAGDPGYAITTFVLKFIIGITCGAVAHKVFKLRDQDRHSAGYLVKVIVSAGSGLLLNVFTDPFLGYFRNVYIFGQEYTVAQALTKIAGGVTFVNSVASTACAVVLYLALRPALERAKLLSKGENKAV